MGILAASRKLAFSLLVAFYRAACFFLSRPDKLHNARFARIDELTILLGNILDRRAALLLGISRFDRVLCVRSSQKRRELGNLLVVAPTRGGKGLLAVSQLLTWPHSVIVNDIKGDLFAQTAGDRRKRGNVRVFDTTGVGHRFDPLNGRLTEDELLSSATRLLFKPDEGDGAIFTQRASVMLTQLFLAARLEGIPPFLYVRLSIRAGLAQTARRLNASPRNSPPSFSTSSVLKRISAIGFFSRPGERSAPGCARS